MSIFFGKSPTRNLIPSQAAITLNRFWQLDKELNHLPEIYRNRLVATPQIQNCRINNFARSTKNGILIFELKEFFAQHKIG